MKRLCLLAAFLMTCAAASPQPVPLYQWHDAARVWAARTCYAEARWSEHDCAGVLWVIVKRYRRVANRNYRDPLFGGLRLWTWTDMLREYASVGQPKPRYRMSAKQSEIRALPWGNLSELPEHVRRKSPKMPLERFNTQWMNLRDLVVRWGAGEVPDPCPEADHWRGRMDRGGASWKVVKCSEQTSNTFLDGPG